LPTFFFRSAVAVFAAPSFAGIATRLPCFAGDFFSSSAKGLGLALSSR
jgi:hypothetical protein